MTLALGHDEEPRKARRAHDCTGRGTGDARSDPCAKRHVARQIVVEGDRAVGSDARDAGWGDDARRSGGALAPEELARRTVEAEGLRRCADDDPIAAEERRAEIDAGHERLPALRVAKARGCR